jgi:hypothetical protein
VKSPKFLTNGSCWQRNSKAFCSGFVNIAMLDFAMDRGRSPFRYRVSRLIVTSSEVMRQQETAGRYFLARPPLVPTNPLSIFPSLATGGCGKITQPDLGPIHGQSTRNRFRPFSLPPTLHFIVGSQKRKNFVHDVPVYPFVQGLSSTIFVSASFYFLWRFVSIKQMCVIVTIRTIP